MDAAGNAMAFFMDAPLFHPLAPIFPALSAVHTVGGHYVYLNERSFRSLGVDSGALIDQRWQDFAPAAEIDDEVAAVRQALGSGKPVRLSRVRRRWSAIPVDLDVTIIPVRSRRGTMLVSRHARLIEPATAGAAATPAALMADLQAAMTRS